MSRTTSLTNYPRRRDVLSVAREPTERELRIDLRPGAENPIARTRECGVQIGDVREEDLHMASAHPDLEGLLELLADIYRSHSLAEVSRRRRRTSRERAPDSPCYGHVPMWFAIE